MTQPEDGPDTHDEWAGRLQRRALAYLSEYVEEMRVLLDAPDTPFVIPTIGTIYFARVTGLGPTVTFIDRLTDIGWEDDDENQMAFAFQSGIRVSLDREDIHVLRVGYEFDDTMSGLELRPPDLTIPYQRDAVARVETATPS